MQVWDQFVAAEEKNLGQATANKWLKVLRLVKFDAANIYLEAPDAFHKIWFEEHIRPSLKHKLLDANQRPIKVHISVVSEDYDSNIKVQPTSHPSSENFELIYDELIYHYTFDNFIPCKKNTLPYTLLQELANPNTTSNTFNPIFLYGLSGSGKTHLLMAIARLLTQSGQNVVYTKTSSFTENTIKAIRLGKMAVFRNYYRHADVLIVDDVHLLSKKVATQEEFFHTFNTLHVENKQIILSAKVSPQELVDIEPRLVSRFEWGITLPLLLPDKEIATKILESRLKQHNFPLIGEIEQYLVDTFAANPKQLEKALNALMLRIHLHHPSLNNSKKLTLDQTKKILSDLIRDQQAKQLDADKIIASCASFYGIRIHDILGKARSRDCVLPRQIAMYLCREYLSLPFMKIGEIFARDHSTVMTSVRQIQHSMAVHDETSIAVKTIVKSF